MPADPRLIRWVRASLADHVKAALTAAGLPSAVDGLDDRDDAFMALPDRAEVAINGPAWRQLNHGAFRVQVNVNVIVSSIMGLDRNAYTHDTLAGRAKATLDQVIPVKDHGDSDPAVTLFCLRLRDDIDPSLLVQQIHLDTTDRRRHTVIDARYVGIFLN